MYSHTNFARKYTQHKIKYERNNIFRTGDAL
jgi:hypothetical protein